MDIKQILVIVELENGDAHQVLSSRERKEIALDLLQIDGTLQLDKDKLSFELQDVLADKEPKTCKWSIDDPECCENTYQTDCNESFYFNDGGIKGNGFKYCPYCMLEIEEV